jgi:HlyD family secretion protein
MNASVAFVDKDQSGSRSPVPVASVLAIPSSAVRNGTVFVVVNSLAVRRLVTLGRANGDKTEVRNGLSNGDNLIVNPPVQLKDGDKVRIRKD